MNSFYRVPLYQLNNTVDKLPINFFNIPLMDDAYNEEYEIADIIEGWMLDEDSSLVN